MCVFFCFLLRSFQRLLDSIPKPPCTCIGQSSYIATLRPKYIHVHTIKAHGDLANPSSETLKLKEPYTTTYNVGTCSLRVYQGSTKDLYSGPAVGLWAPLVVLYGFTGFWV